LEKPLKKGRARLSELSEELGFIYMQKILVNILESHFGCYVKKRL
jgi:hypothetical protein